MITYDKPVLKDCKCFVFLQTMQTSTKKCLKMTHLKKMHKRLKKNMGNLICEKERKMITADNNH